MMVEIIDDNTNRKMMAMILCNICYNDDCYVIYAIQREKDEANIFVSKLVKNTNGYVFDYNFSNGEKNVMDNVIKRILNRDNLDILNRDGFFINNDITYDDILYFNIDKCYVSTVSKSLIKDCLVYYDLVNEKMFEQPLVEVIEDKRKFNEGFVGNVMLIMFGIFILIFSIIGIWGVLFG